MKKIEKNLILLLLLCNFCCGCRESKAYMDESEISTEDDAVDAVQISGSYTEKVTMEGLRSAVINIIGAGYQPNERIPREELLKQTGVSEDVIIDSFGERIHQGTSLDELIILQVKEDRLSEVENKMNLYREELLKKYEKQKQSKSKIYASRIEVIDQYICYVQLGADTSHLADASEEEIITYCQHENERAVDAIEKAILE